jgi:ribonuclease Z
MIRRMQAAVVVFGLLAPLTMSVGAVVETRQTGESSLKVILLGTRGGPVIDPQHTGIGTLIVAGPERLLFDCGRGVPTAIARAGIAPRDITKVFITHLHSDHLVGLPELYLYPWASESRAAPFLVWGPTGTEAMMANLQKAFEFDIHVRRDVDETFSAEGIRVAATDVREGVVYDVNGVKVTAFFVDHAPVTPALGYRVDHQGHSVVLSGDTRPSENLVTFAKGADVLIHEAGTWKKDPRLAGPPDERFGDSRGTRRQVRTIAEHHTDPEEAGQIFARVTPKLALFSHYNPTPSMLSLVRQHYAGPVELGEDGMTIEVGEAVTLSRPR